MKWTIGQVEKDCFVRITLEGNFSNDEFKVIFEEAFAREYWQPGMNLLFDNLNLNLKETNLEIITLASHCYGAYHSHIGDGKLALLMDTIADFARGRQFELLLGMDSPTDIRIFRKEDEAIKWLIPRPE